MLNRQHTNRTQENAAALVGGSGGSRGEPILG